MVGRACAQHYPILPVAGSPHGIFSMMQDQTSALWLGTIDDVVRFDGANFYSLRSYGFPKETPNGFAEDAGGGIWIATQGTDSGGGTGRGGLYRYQAGRVEKMQSGDGLSVVSISPTMVLASLGTELQGKPAFGDLVLFQKIGDSWTSKKLLEKQSNHLTVDPHGNLLFPCPGGWCEVLHQNLLETANSRKTLEVKRNAGSPLIERVLRDHLGCIWFRAEAFASYQCPGDTEPKAIPATVSRYDSSAHLEEAPDGSIFMLVPLALGRPGAFHVASAPEGLPNDMDTAIIARDGTIWIGSDSGLYRFMYPFQLTLWDKSDGIESPISILREGKDVFESANGIRRLTGDSNRWTLLDGSAGMTANLAAGPHSTLFAATRSTIEHLHRDGAVLAKTAIPDGDQNFRLAASPDGEVWLGHRGVSRVISTGNVLISHSERISDNRIDDIQYDDPRHTLWACDGNTVLFLKDGEWGIVSQKDGLLDLPCQAIAIQANGDLWLGYKAAAFASIRYPVSGHPVVRNFTQWLNEVAPDTAVHFLSIDRRGWVWRNNDALYVATAAGAEASEWLRLDDHDGLSSPPIQGGSPFAADPDGSVWVGTANGLAHFSPPENFTTAFPVPSVFISGFSIGQSTIPADVLRELPRSFDVTVHIGSLQFDRRSALRIRYRLLPEQTAWNDASGLDLHLQKLSWGNHVLEVQARMASGPWSQASAQSLSVPFPFWLRWPGLLILGFGGAGVGVGFRRWLRHRRLIRSLTLPNIDGPRKKALSPESADFIGTVLNGRYEIGEILFIGGLSTVVRARDLHKDGMLCAVKLFESERADQAWILHRFEQEVEALELLNHPHIVRIEGHGITPTGAPYLVMEFIQGETLRKLLEWGALPCTLTARFLNQLASALSALHSNGIFHRDLKPENLMVRVGEGDQEEIVLIDFSIAIVKSPEKTFQGISRVAGTLEYMAPEQVIGYAAAATDIYSLAKVLLEMLTGSRWSELIPEATMDSPERIVAMLKARRFRLSAPSLAMIASALQFDPVRRPENVLLFAEPIVSDLSADA